ncbi:hypothetical protein MKEN_00180600 [Mycena kentingensis (nom. inval.)]|nr:hypothetical protein MKEN_00180600 [Mycena kentingensis (nom. inval.)]
MSGVQNTTKNQNQGIVDGRAAGAPVPAAPVTLDSYTDKDATGRDPASTRLGALDFPGAASKDVHVGLGQPVYGETSNELRHDGQRGRKKQEIGVENAHGSRAQQPKDVEI